MPNQQGQQNPQSSQNPHTFSFVTLAIILIAAFGVGVFLQEWRSGAGYAPFTPPVSLPASLLVIAAVLLVLSLRLKAAIENTKAGRVNPFHAVRLLAAARASQITGTIFSGFALGLIIIILGRTVAVRPGVWVPMLATLITAILLLAAGFYAEHVCRVPPEDEDGADAKLSSNPTS